MQCTSQSKQSGYQCRKDAVVGYQVCHIHGGKTPRGLAHPSTTHGRYSKSLPARMLSKYDEAREDREFLALSEDIALIDARLEDVLGRVDTGECGENWKALGLAVKEFNEFERKATCAVTEGKRDEYNADRNERMRMICFLVEAGISDFNAWQELKGWLETRRKTVETEQKRLVSMQQMMSADQAEMLKARILSIIRANVQDRHALTAISREFELLTPQGRVE